MGVKSEYFNMTLGVRGDDGEYHSLCEIQDADIISAVNEAVSDKISSLDYNKEFTATISAPKIDKDFLNQMRSLVAQSEFYNMANDLIKKGYALYGVTEEDLLNELVNAYRKAIKDNEVAYYLDNEHIFSICVYSDDRDVYLYVKPVKLIDVTWETDNEQ